jgi:hypothetical protein
VQRADLKSAHSAKPDVPCLLERWEPLKGRQAWIDDVLAGDLAGSMVVDFKDGVAGSATAAKVAGSAAGAKTESKAEGKGASGSESRAEAKSDAATA